jgi:creatinine amidohydrolase
MRQEKFTGRSPAPVWPCLVASWLLLTPGWAARPSQDRPASVELENLTWVQAEQALKDLDVVLIALGARTKEHGPHLPLKTDYVLAEYLKDRVAAEVPVAVLPTIPYGHYPSFLEYPGSVSIGAAAFKDLVKDICRSMSGYGARKFYVLNTGISTLKPLAEAAEELDKDGLILRFLDLADVDKTLPRDFLKQEGGSHADEAETSMMLFIAPQFVDMSKAVKELDLRPGRKGLTRRPDGPGAYSKTGIWGDPTLASAGKGRAIVEAAVRVIIGQIRDLIDLKPE